MRKLQNKFLTVFICISILPLLCVGIYAMFVNVEMMTENVNRSNIAMLESADKLLYEKVKNVQRWVDLIRRDERVLQAIFDNEDQAGLLYESLKNILYGCEEIIGVCVYAPDGNITTYNIDTSSFDAVRFQIQYQRVDKQPGFITWFGTDRQLTEVGINTESILCATSTSQDGRYANIYFILDQSIFRQIVQSSELGGEMFVMDEKGNCIVNTNSSISSIAMRIPISCVSEIYALERGTIRLNPGGNSGSSEILSFYTSALTSWKFVSLQSHNVFYGQITNIAVTLVTILIIVTMLFVLVHMSIIKYITSPLVRLSNVMKNFDITTLENVLPVTTNDEIGTVTEGFNRMILRIDSMLKTIEEKEKQKKQLEIKALMYQINPHFLSNTLNAIRIMAISNKQKEIANALASLSKMFRGVLALNKGYTTLKDEFVQLDNYIEIMKISNKLDLTVEYNLPDELVGLRIPSMLIQPIAENAFKHGLRECTRSGRLKLCVGVQENKGRLLIEVFDNGCGIPKDDIAKLFDFGLQSDKDSGSSIGIRNVIERIKLLYGDEYGIDICSEHGEFTRVTLVLPLP